MKKFCGYLLKLAGWKTILTVQIPSKCVICVAPHTSNLDFIIGKLFYASVGGKPHFLMKKEWFFFPMNLILKAIGGIPVDRKKKHSLTEQMIGEFNRRSHFQLAIAPEGTRKKTSQLKTGFYYIALGAKVPIAMAFIDYPSKTVAINNIFNPTGNEESDMLYVKSFYKPYQGRHPEKFGI